MVQKTKNPFTPTFGHVPFALAGRTGYIDDVVGGLANYPGDPNRSTIFIGSRGSGKTVLLTALSRIASEQGWVSANMSARNGMLEEIVWQLRSNAAHLITPESKSDITPVQLGPIAASREMKHESVTWRYRLSSMVEELNAQGVGVLFTVDEINPDCEDFATFVDVYQHLVREERDVALLLAGLPSRVSSLLLDENISFIRRAFQRSMDAIPQLEVEEALLETIQANGRDIEAEALARASEATRGFAFAIQLVGYYLWRASSPEGKMTVEDAEQAIRLARQEMERSVFAPTLQELRPRELQYLQAMAQDDGPSTTSDVAKRMGIGMTNASNLRRRLIEHGVISEVRMGVVDIEIPMLREWLRGE